MLMIGQVFAWISGSLHAVVYRYCRVNGVVAAPRLEDECEKSFHAAEL